MKFKTLLFLSATVFACAPQILPVKGQFQDGSDVFAGTAEGSATGNGVLSIRSNRGLSCSGAFTYVADLAAEGTLTCTDGTSGPFTFVSTGNGGSGSGTLGGKVITFTAG